MRYVRPDYYDAFQCTAGSCPDTCCAGWQIRIDEKSLKRYSAMKGPFGSRLRNEIDWENRCFRQYQGKCSLLNEEGLCDLYQEGGGEKALCRTCHVFPRHAEEFQGVREYSLSLSCPEAAKQILMHPGPVRLLERKKPGVSERWPGFDSGLFQVLVKARKLCLQILQNREKPWRLRAVMVLTLAHDLQERIRRNNYAAGEELFRRYKTEKAWSWFERKLRELEEREAFTGLRQGTLRHLLAALENLRPLREDWKPYLRGVLQAQARGERPGEQEAMRALFPDETAEQLMAYFVYVYFCGAVYDGNAWGKMKFAFASVICVRELLRGRWRQDPEGVSKESAIRAACRYSREVEHLDENLLGMERMLGDEKQFSLERLFSAAGEGKR